jgi:hypothetical protein
MSRSTTITAAPILIEWECVDGAPDTITTPSPSYFCSLTTGPGITRATLTASDPALVGTAATFRNIDDTQTVTVRSVTAPASDTPSGTASDVPPIPAWVQAYGRASADATCLDGWAASWQSWAEPVTGGWVCTRSIPSLG